MAIKSDPAHWRDPRHRRGLAGERIARRYLELRHWRILEHRFRVGRTEIDLIARRGRQVIFVEVKTRAGTSFGSPFEAVHRGKQREIARVARAWIDRHGGRADLFRFDVIAVTMTSAGPLVQHLADAFRADWR